MNIWRMIVGSTVRAVVYRIVGLAFLIGAAALSGKAQAQTCGPTGICTWPDQGAASAACASEMASLTPFDVNASLERIWCTADAGKCQLSGSQYYGRLQNRDKPGGATGACFATTPSGSGPFHYHSWVPGQTCASRPSQVTTRMPLGGSTQCINGCMYRYALNGDDETSTRSPTGGLCNNTKDNCPVGSFYNVLMNVCQPLAPECKAGEVLKDGVCERQADCPEGMVSVLPGTPGGIASGEMYCKPKAPECPPGNIKSPAGTCLPGEGQCAAGEAKKKDGTCGKDGNGDGVPDDEDTDPENDTDKETYSGGENCVSPPSCNGSPILCGQARTQWRIECNTRKNRNISGGACSAAPICTGDKCDAVEYSSLLMQWRTACALEKATQPGEGEEGEKIKPDFEALVGGGDGDNGEGTIFVEDGEAQDFDQGLVSYAGGQVGYNFNVEGTTFAMPQQIMDFVAMLRTLIIAAAALIGIAIVWGNL